MIFIFINDLAHNNHNSSLILQKSCAVAYVNFYYPTVVYRYAPPPKFEPLLIKLYVKYM